MIYLRYTTRSVEIDSSVCIESLFRVPRSDTTDNAGCGTQIVSAMLPVTSM